MLIFQSIIVYTLLTVMMCCCAHYSQMKSKASLVLAWIPIILFSLVFGLRYGVGIDYNNYMETYECTEEYSFSELLEYQGYEEGFSLILYLCHWFDAPTYVFFTILAFLQIFFIYKTFKKEGDVLPYIYMSLILSGTCMLGYMNIIRQSISACIFLYSLQYVRDNKLLKYWICCAIALSFHHSAMILFPLYFIWIKKKGIFNKPFVEFLILLLSVIGMYLTSWQSILHQFDNIIPYLGYGFYSDTADTMTSGGRGLGMFDILRFILLSIIVLHSNQIKDYFKSDLLNILYDIFLIGVCAGYIFNGSLLMGRIIVYFTNTEYIMIAYALCYLYHVKRQSTQLFIKYAFCILFITLQYGRFIYYCEENTGAYVSYFQTELHDLKDVLRDDMLHKRD